MENFIEGFASGGMFIIIVVAILIFTDERPNTNK